MTPAIETFGLTKRYGATTAVGDLNLRIEPGQVFGFLGPNGDLTINCPHCNILH